MRTIVGFLVLLMGAPAAAAGLRDLEDAWLLPPWPLLRPQPETGPGWIGWVAAGSGRLYEMPELPLHGLDAAFGLDRRRALWLVQVSWQVLGENLYRADRREIRVGRYGAWRTVLRLEREVAILAGREAPIHAAADLVLGRTISLAAGIRFVGDLHVPLTALPRAADPRVRPVGRFLLGTSTAALAAAWDRRGDGTPLLGGELALVLSPAACLLLRFDGGSGSLGPGLVLRWDGLLLRTSHVVHPALGVSHRFQLVVGAPPRQWPSPGP